MTGRIPRCGILNNGVIIKRCEFHAPTVLLQQKLPGLQQGTEQNNHRIELTRSIYLYGRFNLANEISGKKAAPPT